MIRVEHADMMEAIPRLAAEGVVVDSVVTDPPYHLAATASRFGGVSVGADTSTSRRSRLRSDAAGRLARGFMGQTWDGGDVAFRPETWAAVATIMRPGAFLVAFGGTRTHHRLVCAIEDAGFVVQDTIMWLFGSGFPKRRDMLKPAFEPICLAYKPGGRRTMQVDECRIATGDSLGGGDQSERLKTKPEGWDRPWMQDPEAKAAHAMRVNGNVAKAEALGRWPANIAHDGSDEVRAAFPASAGQQSDVTGEEPSHKSPFQSRQDDGSAARFFFSAKADADDRWHSAHPTVKPVDLMAWLVRLATPPGGTVLDPFAGSGTTGAAAAISRRSAILIEREARYVADIRERLASLRGEATKPVPRRNRVRYDQPGIFSEC